MPNNNVGRLTYGQFDWSAGVNSDKSPTIAGPGIPNGIRPDQLVWGNNLTVRGSTISPRRAFKYLCTLPIKALFQEANMYSPLGEVFPYPIAQIGGRTFRTDVDTGVTVEITSAGDPNPADRPQSWMCQAEQFLVIQDGVSPPLVWDGTTLRRVTAMANASPKIPTAECMDYYQGRLWLAYGREYVASDIVGGPSGTAQYKFTDSVLSMNENTYLSLGGTFRVPDLGGNIRALKHPVTLDTALGEGQLFVLTRERVYSVNVVPTRAQWQALKEPIQRVAQINFGTTSDRSVVGVNGDLFMQSPDGVRSMTEAVRYFEQWGNIPISVEENRAIDLNDRELLRFGSGISFDNRVLQTCLPFVTEVGVAHKALMPLNFDTISTLAQKSPPAWEGVLEGLNFLRVIKGDFGGRQRAFAYVLGRTGDIELWEISSQEVFDFNRDGEARVPWVIEFPAYTWNDAFLLKQLDTAELWVDQVRGDVEFYMEFRPDQHPCWEYYHAWQICAPRDNCDLPGALSDCYPTQSFRQQYEATMVLPKAPSMCERRMARPMDIGYTFQLRLRIKGFCRIRGIMVYAYPRDRQIYERMVCGGGLNPSNTPMPMKTI